VAEDVLPRALRLVAARDRQQPGDGRKVIVKGPAEATWGS